MLIKNDKSDGGLMSPKQSDLEEINLKEPYVIPKLQMLFTSGVIMGSNGTNVDVANIGS